MSVEAPERQLEWEARAGRLAAVAAFVGGLLPFVGAVVFRASLGEVGGGTVDFLTAVDGAPGGVLAGAVLGAIGTLAVPVALAYLHRATRARRPESAGFALPLLAVAAVGVAAVLAVEQVALLDVAGQVAELEEPTEEEADGLVEDSSLSQIATMSFVFRVAFGASLLMIALNAMRTGLLSRFMGIIGIGTGVFYAIPILVEPTLIQLFWLVALGLLFLGRWPGGGRGPAWERVEAVPWPTAAQRAEAQRGGTSAGESAARTDAPGSDGHEVTTGADGDAPPERPRPASRKKRRGR